MPIYQAIVLAIVQGIAEFLPISSTAHLALFPWLLHWQDPGLTFDVALHAGTLVAVLLYFWRTWVDLAMAGVGRGNRSDPIVQHNRLMFWYMMIATVPGGIAGLLFEKQAESELRSPFVIGAALILVGLLMWGGEKVANHTLQFNKVGFADALVVGVSQALAIIPGVSRSGITMTAGLFRGMSRETAARFSFLLSTPLIAGAALKKFLEIRHEGLPADMRLPFGLGIIVAGLVGYVVIAFLIRYLERKTFKIFVVYRVAAGVLVLALGWGLRH
jgi:undecaprenyl-diphosphatase